MHHQELKKLRVELQSALVRMMRGSSGVQFDHEEFAVACHALTWEVLAFHDFMDHSPRIVDDVWCSRLKPSFFCIMERRDAFAFWHPQNLSFCDFCGFSSFCVCLALTHVAFSIFVPIFATLS